MDKPAFFDCIEASTGSIIFNFFENYLYLNSVSGKLGFNKYTVINPLKEHVELVSRDHSFPGFISDALKVASYALSFFQPVIFGSLLLLSLAAKALNRYSHSYQIFIPNKDSSNQPSVSPPALIENHPPLLAQGENPSLTTQKQTEPTALNQAGSEQESLISIPLPVKASFPQPSTPKTTSTINQLALTHLLPAEPAPTTPAVIEQNQGIDWKKSFENMKSVITSREERDLKELMEQHGLSSVEHLPFQEKVEHLHHLLLKDARGIVEAKKIIDQSDFNIRSLHNPEVYRQIRDLVQKVEDENFIRMIQRLQTLHVFNSNRDLGALPIKEVREEFVRWIDSNPNLPSKLDFSNCNLTFLPWEIVARVSKVDEINLSGNALIALPEQIDLFTHLKVLNVQKNQLQHLPKEICTLKQLKHLNLASNQFAKVPKEIYQIKSLEHLDLTNNRIEGISTGIYLLNNLKTLILTRNLIEQLPLEICKLPQLKVLDLSSNQLEMIPSDIKRLTRLKKLVLCGNKFREFPLETCSLSLVELDLSFNRIPSVPSKFSRLKKSLIKLNLSHNELTSVHQKIGNLTAMKELNLSFNQLTTLPLEIEKLANHLTSVKLKNNPWQKFPRKLQSINEKNPLKQAIVNTGINEWY